MSDEVQAIIDNAMRGAEAVREHLRAEAFDLTDEEDDVTYRIVRFYRDDEDLNRTIVTTGLTLEQAQAHCNDPETSSRTATTPEARDRTERHHDFGRETDHAE